MRHRAIQLILPFEPALPGRQLILGAEIVADDDADNTTTGPFSMPIRGPDCLPFDTPLRHLGTARGRSVASDPPIRAGVVNLTPNISVAATRPRHRSL